MHPAPTQIPRSTPKRDHLLDTAFRLFYRDGYHAVGIDTILAEAKLAKMTLYHHFSSKEELIVALLDRRSTELGEKVRGLIDQAGSSPRKRFLAYLDRYDAWFASPSFNGCPFIRAVGEYPKIDSPVHQAAIRHKHKGIDTLRELLVGLGVADPVTLANQVSLLIEGAIVSTHTFGDTKALSNARAAALSLLKSAPRK